MVINEAIQRAILEKAVPDSYSTFRHYSSEAQKLLDRDSVKAMTVQLPKLASELLLSVEKGELCTETLTPDELELTLQALLLNKKVISPTIDAALRRKHTIKGQAKVYTDLENVGRDQNPEIILIAQQILADLFEGMDEHMLNDPKERRVPAKGVHSNGTSVRDHKARPKLLGLYNVPDWYDNVSTIYDLLDAKKARLEIENGRLINLRNPEYVEHFALVPKTSIIDRCVATQELDAIYRQKGQNTQIRQWLRRRKLSDGYQTVVLKEQIDFKDQSRQQYLALEGSRISSTPSTDYVQTFDFSEASDRVTTELCKQLLPKWLFDELNDTSCRKVRFDKSDGKRFVDLVRSKGCEIEYGVSRDHIIVSMHRFLSMGNGVCFPIETVVFYAITAATLIDLGYNYYDALSKVNVFGDDVIVRAGDDFSRRYEEVVSGYGWVINRGKSFSRRGSGIREACGVYAYKGQDIRPIYLHYDVSHSLDNPSANAEAVVSIVETRNRLHMKGFDDAVRLLDDVIDKSTLLVPYGTIESSVIVRVVRKGPINKEIPFDLKKDMVHGNFDQEVIRMNHWLSRITGRVVYVGSTEYQTSRWAILGYTVRAMKSEKDTYARKVNTRQIGKSSSSRSDRVSIANSGLILAKASSPLYGTHNTYAGICRKYGRKLNRYGKTYLAEMAILPAEYCKALGDATKRE